MSQAEKAKNDRCHSYKGHKTETRGHQQLCDGYRGERWGVVKEAKYTPTEDDLTLLAGTQCSTQIMHPRSVHLKPT